MTGITVLLFISDYRACVSRRNITETHHIIGTLFLTRLSTNGFTDDDRKSRGFGEMIVHSLKELGGRREHVSLSRDFQRVPAGYGGRGRLSLR